LGYRDREFSLVKPPGVFRIVALGGSTTYTIKVEDNKKTFTAQLEKVLQQKYGYKNVEVINAGVGGYNSWESLINLEFRVLDLDPDLIIVYHGTNDVHTRFVDPSAYRGDNSGKRKDWSAPPLHFFEYSYLYRILSIKLGLASQVGLSAFVNAPSSVGSGDRMELLKANPPVYFRRNLVNMIAIAKAHNVKIMFSTWAHSPYFDDYASTPYYQQGFRENNSVVRHVANKYSVPLFDFAKAMLPAKMYWADGRHVNEMGALLKAELFAAFIQDPKSRQSWAGEPSPKTSVDFPATVIRRKNRRGVRSNV